MKKLILIAMAAMILIAGAMFAFDTSPPIDVAGLQQQAILTNISQFTFASLEQAIVQRNLNSTAVNRIGAWTDCSSQAASASGFSQIALSTSTVATKEVQIVAPSDVVASVAGSDRTVTWAAEVQAPSRALDFNIVPVAAIERVFFQSYFVPSHPTVGAGDDVITKNLTVQPGMYWLQATVPKRPSLPLRC